MGFDAEVFNKKELQEKMWQSNLSSFVSDEAAYLSTKGELTIIFANDPKFQRISAKNKETANKAGRSRHRKGRRTRLRHFRQMVMVIVNDFSTYIKLKIMC